MSLPRSRYALERIEDVAQLEDLLSEPTEAAVETMAGLERVLGVSRFSSPGQREQLGQHGVETVACDLLDPDQLGALPDVPNVVFMTGMKFGSTGAEALTWAMNAFLPG